MTEKEILQQQESNGQTAFYLIAVGMFYHAIYPWGQAPGVRSGVIDLFPKDENRKRKSLRLPLH